MANHTMTIYMSDGQTREKVVTDLNFQAELTALATFGYKDDTTPPLAFWPPGSIVRATVAE